MASELVYPEHGLTDDPRFDYTEHGMARRSELIYRFITDYSKPRQIDGCGMGFTLITKDLFDLEFVFAPGIGEDYDFCKQAQRRGHKIMLESNVRCGHLRVLPVDERMIEDYFKQKTQ